jgi:hypothetical protein
MNSRLKFRRRRREKLAARERLSSKRFHEYMTRLECERINKKHGIK